MAYETGSATGVNDLMDKLRVFAVARGWTLNRWRDGGVNGGKELCLEKSGNYINMYSDNGSSEESSTTIYDPRPIIKIVQSLGFDDSKEVWSQPGSHSKRSATSGLFPPLETYHFFGGNDYIHVVVEVSAGIFAHFGFGIINKAFPFTGGGYQYGTGWNYYFHPTSTYYRSNPISNRHGTPFDMYNSNDVMNSTVDGYSSIRADIDGKSDHFIDTYRSNTDYTGSYNIMSLNPRGGYTGSISSGGRPMMMMGNYQFCTAAYNQQSMLIPSWIGWRFEDARSGILGEIRDWRWVHMNNYAPGQEITLGPDTWMVFPMKAKHMSAPDRTQPNSYTFGIAYRKVI